MRNITTHKVAEHEDTVLLMATDEPGPGGANHTYWIGGFSLDEEKPDGEEDEVTIQFQKGGLKEVGYLNGITNEVLLAIVKDRLECFQAGPFKCDANALALNYTNMALEALKNRTRDRLARGVEGKSET